MKSFFYFVAVLAVVASSALAREAREQQRIDYLLTTVGKAKGIVFIRNGSKFGGPEAEKHLRMKLNYGGERIKTAEQFVQYCATESSITHQKYKVRLGDGTTTDSASYFTGLLGDWDRQKH